MTKSPCPQCGTPRDPAEPCPICLLRLAAAPDSQVLPETEANATKPSHPVPDIETIKRAFPQLEIIEQIGRGGMGTVFKARQPKLDRFVSLKILSEKLAEKPTFAERFAQEGKLLARLSHPNIVTVHDFGQVEVTDDTGKKSTLYFLILEYVDGVNLRQAMREERFTPEQALAIVPKICEALQYAHDESVLHRDIKPENILLDTKGRVKITDFGIGKLTQASEEVSKSTQPSQEESNLTATGVVLGTPNYMAPEQLETPNTVDHRADIYSLGVVFYELLTGELPKGQLTPPSEKTPVNAEIDGIVLKALQRDRTQRHQSAEELKTEIETATLVHSKAETPATKNKQKSRLSPGKAIGFGCLSIIVFVILSFVTVNVFFSRKQAVTMSSDGIPLIIEASHSGMGASPMFVVSLISFLFIVLLFGTLVLLIVFLVRKIDGSQSSTSATVKSDPTVKFCTNCGAEAGENTMACLKCGHALRSKQNYCYHCGVQTDSEQVICVKCGVGFSKSIASDFIGGPKQKLPAALFAILLGSFGVHKFYLESWGWGIVYLIFFWSGIPGFVGIIEGILYLAMNDSAFDVRYNQTKPGPFRW